MTVSLKLGKYEHYKKKDMYEVIGIAKHSETGEKLVVYRALCCKGLLWVRPIEMFVEDVEVGGVMVPRFRYFGGLKK